MSSLMTSTSARTSEYPMTGLARAEIVTKMDPGRALVQPHPAAVDCVSELMKIIRTVQQSTIRVEKQIGGANNPKKTTKIVTGQELVYNYAPVQGLPFPAGVVAGAPGWVLPAAVLDGDDWENQIHRYERQMCAAILSRFDDVSTVYTEIEEALGTEMLEVTAGPAPGSLCTVVKIILGEVERLQPKITSDLQQALSEMSLASTRGILQVVASIRRLIKQSMIMKRWGLADATPGSVWQRQRYREIMDMIKINKSEPELQYLKEDIISKTDPATVKWDEVLKLIDDWTARKQNLDPEFGAELSGYDDKLMYSQGGVHGSIKCYGCGGPHVRRECPTPATQNDAGRRAVAEKFGKSSNPQRKSSMGQGPHGTQNGVSSKKVSTGPSRQTGQNKSRGAGAPRQGRGPAQGGGHSYRGSGQGGGHGYRGSGQGGQHGHTSASGWQSRKGVSRGTPGGKRPLEKGFFVEARAGESKDDMAERIACQFDDIFNRGSTLMVRECDKYDTTFGFYDNQRIPEIEKQFMTPKKAKKLPKFVKRFERAQEKSYNGTIEAYQMPEGYDLVAPGWWNGDIDVLSKIDINGTFVEDRWNTTPGVRVGGRPTAPIVKKKKQTSHGQRSSIRGAVARSKLPPVPLFNDLKVTDVDVAYEKNETGTDMVYMLEESKHVFIPGRQEPEKVVLDSSTKHVFTPGQAVEGIPYRRLPCGRAAFKFKAQLQQIMNKKVTTVQAWLIMEKDIPQDVVVVKGKRVGCFYFNVDRNDHRKSRMKLDDQWQHGEGGTAKDVEDRIFSFTGKEPMLNKVLQDEFRKQEVAQATECLDARTGKSRWSHQGRWIDQVDGIRLCPESKSEETQDKAFSLEVQEDQEDLAPMQRRLDKMLRITARLRESIAVKQGTAEVPERAFALKVKRDQGNPRPMQRRVDQMRRITARLKESTRLSRAGGNQHSTKGRTSDENRRRLKLKYEGATSRRNGSKFRLGADTQSVPDRMQELAQAAEDEHGYDLDDALFACGSHDKKRECVSDTGATVAVSSDSTMFGKNRRFDFTKNRPLRTAGSLMKGGGSGEWLTTKFWDGDEISAQFPIYWRYEPNMRLEDGQHLYLLPSKKLADITPGSSSTCGGGEGLGGIKIADPDDPHKILYEMKFAERTGTQNQDMFRFSVEQYDGVPESQHDALFGADRVLYGAEQEVEDLEDINFDDQAKGVHGVENDSDGHNALISHTTVANDVMQVWHARMLHASENTVKKTLEFGTGGIVQGLKFHQRKFCPSCVEGKGELSRRLRPEVGHGTSRALDELLGERGATKGMSRKQVFDIKLHVLKKVKSMVPKEETEMKKFNRPQILLPGQVVSADLIGPFLKGPGQFYIMIYVDCATKYGLVYDIDAKSKAPMTLSKMKQFFTQRALRVQSVVTDPAGENIGKVWHAECAALGILPRPLMARQQWLNRVERHIKDLTAAWRTTMIHAKLPLTKKILTNVIEGVQRVYNGIGRASLGWKSPYYAMNGVDFDWSNVHVIGSIVYAIKPNAVKGNGAFGPRALPSIYMGPDEYARGSNCYLMEEDRMIRCNDIRGTELVSPRSDPPSLLIKLGVAQSRFVYKGTAAQPADTGRIPRTKEILDSNALFSYKRICPANEVTIQKGVTGVTQVPRHRPLLQVPQVPMHKMIEAVKGVMAPQGAVQKKVAFKSQLDDQGSSLASTRARRTGCERKVVNRSRFTNGNDKIFILDNDVCTNVEIAVVHSGEWEEVNPSPQVPFLQENEADQVQGIIEVVYDKVLKIDKVESIVCADDKRGPGQEFGLNTSGMSLQERSELYHIIPSTEPMNYRQAIQNNPDALEAAGFKAALEKEWFAGMVDKGLVEYCEESEVPDGVQIVPLMSIFIRKLDEDGKLLKLKARVVLRGDLMSVEGLKLSDIRAPTCGLETGRAAIALSTADGVETQKLDVSQAFLMATPGRELYGYTCQGTHRFNGEGKKLITRILRNLYGSVEAALRWARLAIQCIVNRIGFQRSRADVCMFRKCLRVDKFDAEIAKWRENEEVDVPFRGIDTSDSGGALLLQEDSDEKKEVDAKAKAFGKDYRSTWTPPKRSVDIDWQSDMDDIHHYESGEDYTKELRQFDYSQLIESQPAADVAGYTWVVMVLYVDDAFLCGNDKAAVKYCADRFLKMYPGTQEGDPTAFVGYKIGKAGDDTTITQDVLIKKVLAEMDLTDGKPSKVPLTLPVLKGSDGEIQADKAWINDNVDVQKVMGMINYLRGTQVTTLFAQSQLARITSYPTKANIKQLQCLTRYLKSRVGSGVRFRKDNPQDLILFSDTSHGTDVWTSIYVMFRGGIIYAKAVRHKFQSLSSFDSELGGLSEAAKTAFYFRALTRDLGHRPNGPVIIVGDNQASINEMERGLYSSSRKPRHHAIRQFWAKELVHLGVIKFVWGPGTSNFSDIGTKVLANASKFQPLADQAQGLAPLDPIICKVIEDGSEE